MPKRCFYSLLSPPHWQSSRFSRHLMLFGICKFLARLLPLSVLACLHEHTPRLGILGNLLDVCARPSFLIFFLFIFPLLLHVNGELTDCISVKAKRNGKDHGRGATFDPAACGCGLRLFGPSRYRSPRPFFSHQMAWATATHTRLCIISMTTRTTGITNTLESFTIESSKPALVGSPAARLLDSCALAFAKARQGCGARPVEFLLLLVSNNPVCGALSGT